MATRIKLRRDTAANWLAQNPILALGEPGFETDTRMMKMGDGSTAWTDLKYAVTGDLQVSNDTIHGDTSVSLSSGLGNRENWIVSTNSNTGGFSDPIDGFADGIAYDSLGNAYVMGYYGDVGCFLQKISPSGEVLFNNYYDQYDSYGYGIEVDSHDNIIIILGENSGSGGSTDILLVKISSEDGTIIWQKSINSYGDGNDYATCIDTDANGDIFIVGSTPGSGADCYVGKFSGANGNSIWQKKYDIEGFDDTGTGVCVDKDGNLGVVGTTVWDSEFIPVYKIDGNTGEFLWQGKVLNVKWNNGNQYTYGDIRSSDICSDSNGDFYFTFTAQHPFWPGGISMAVKFNGSTGATAWARQIGWDDYHATAGSVICDELDNVYVSSNVRKDKNNFDGGNSSRLTQHITKFNSTGSVIWQRWLSPEQAEDVDTNQYGIWDGNTGWNSQNIRVNDNYVLVCGNHVEQSDYNDDSQNWYVRPYVAQLNRDGTEFEVSGWTFKAANKDIQFVTLLKDDNNWEFDSASMSDADIQVSVGNVNVDSNTDTTDLVYVNSTRESKVTFTEKTLTLPSGGTIDVGREKNGYFTAIGSFDGTEGGNSNGAVWLNGSARDDAGNTYSAGGWYTYDNWNDWNNYENIPMVFKTDANGKLIWSAGNALDQNWSSPDLVDVAYHAPTNTVVALGNDGELDGNEGFNVMYLDADTGGMTQDITHIRPGDQDSDIYPQSLRIMSDGTPVVSGYINSSAATYSDVTNGGAGLAGSSDGFLVVNKTAFAVEGRDTEYPDETGDWYIYPAGASVYKVNSYGYDESGLSIAYTGTLGSGAVVDVTITSGTASIAGVNPGSGYKAGHKLKVLGTALGGTTPNNDLYFYIDTVDGDGAITALALGTDWEGSAAPDGTYTSVATTAVSPMYLAGWVNYLADSTTYVFNKTSNGYYYGVGDTVKILGTALGGTSPANDLTITVDSISGTGSGQGQVDGFTVTGLAQTTTIKLYAGSDDYTLTGEYNVVHETGDDSFVWTPNWSIGFGTVETTGNNYDQAFGLALDSSDNVIIGGYSDNLGLGNTYWGWPQRAYVAKISSTGEKLWAVSVDGSEGYSTTWGVATDADDNVYAAVETNSDDLSITKLDSDGNFVWQRVFNFYWVNQPSIEITPEGDILIAVEAYENITSNDYYHTNGNIYVLKLDRDGNTLFTRLISSPDGIRNNNNDNYSNSLTVKGSRFSIVGYSNNPGGEDYQGIVIDLPTDGTGVGQYGDFEYTEIELSERHHFITNDAWGTPIVSPVTFNSRPHIFNEAPYIEGEAWRNVTIYGNRDYQTQTVYKPEGGEIKRVAKITFEDGSVQTSSMQGLPQVQRSRTGTDMDYWLRLEDNGKHIYNVWNSAIVIPDRDRLNLPIGYAITIINGSNSTGIRSENNDNYIYLSGDNGSGSYAYTVPSWSMATLVKISDNNWMIAGAGISSGW